jgi:Fe2+ or Zn2+ uptake regulation protein
MSELTDVLQEAFRESGHRLTSQRRLILEVLESSDQHLDAEAIYDQARGLNPNVSLATVYRALAVLKKIGLIEEHRLGEEHGHYESVRDEPHYHFTCLSCGKITEFDTPLVAQIKQELSEQTKVRVTSAHLHLSGYCPQCQNNAKGHNNGKE